MHKNNDWIFLGNTKMAHVHISDTQHDNKHSSVDSLLSTCKCNPLM